MTVSGEDNIGADIVSGCYVLINIIKHNKIRHIFLRYCVAVPVSIMVLVMLRSFASSSPMPGDEKSAKIIISSMSNCFSSSARHAAVSGRRLYLFCTNKTSIRNQRIPLPVLNGQAT